MNANERFEYMAELFYKETGYVAPGKDLPAALNNGGYTDVERDNAWGEWLERFWIEMFELHKNKLDNTHRSD